MRRGGVPLISLIPLILLVLLAPSPLTSTAHAAATKRLGAPTQTRPIVRQHPAAGVPTLVGVRTGRHPRFDRVVFDLEDSQTGYLSVRYVPRIVSDGSGQHVPMRGRAYLEVVFDATAHDDSGQRTFPQPRRLSLNYRTLQQVAFVSDFEGRVTFGLGLRERVGFRVFELRKPHRIVVDVARARRH